MDRGITDLHGTTDGGDPSYLFDAEWRERQHELDEADGTLTRSVFERAPRARRPLVLQPGDRCPGCHVSVVDLDTVHLDSCFYQGRNAAILAVAS